MQYRWRRGLGSVGDSKAINLLLSQKDRVTNIINTMAIKHKIKFKSDELGVQVLQNCVPLVPKQRPERVAEAGVSGESIGRDVPSDDNEYRCGGAYRAILAMFAKHFKKRKTENK